MVDVKLLLEEWETDIKLLEMSLRQADPKAAPHAQAERQRLQQDLQQARQAQALLQSLASLGV